MNNIQNCSYRFKIRSTLLQENVSCGQPDQNITIICNFGYFYKMCNFLKGFLIELRSQLATTSTACRNRPVLTVKENYDWRTNCFEASFVYDWIHGQYWAIKKAWARDFEQWSQYIELLKSTKTNQTPPLKLVQTQTIRQNKLHSRVIGFDCCCWKSFDANAMNCNSCLGSCPR